MQIGSVFEYVNQNPVFGILKSDSIFYAPLLGFFAFTGIPTSVRIYMCFPLRFVELENFSVNFPLYNFVSLQAFLWFKSVQVANKEAEEQDRRDGYL